MGQRRSVAASAAVGRVGARTVGRRPDERGQLLPLIIGFGIIIMLLCAVVFDAAQVFTYRRGLSAIADGAALAATNGIDKAAIYSGGIADRVELSEQLAQEEVDRYTAGYQSLNCLSDVGTAEVTVSCTGSVRLPIVNAISGGQGRITINVQATAETFATP
jgi:Flp pilus assembly protein TadG